LTDFITVVGEEPSGKRFIRWWIIGLAIIILVLLSVKVFGVNKFDYVSLWENKGRAGGEGYTTYKVCGNGEVIHLTSTDNYFLFHDFNPSVLRSVGEISDLQNLRFEINDSVTYVQSCQNESNVSYDCSETHEVFRNFMPYDKTVQANECVKLRVRAKKSVKSNIDNVLYLKVGGVWYNYPEYASWNATNVTAWYQLNSSYADDSGNNNLGVIQGTGGSINTTMYKQSSGSFQSAGTGWVTNHSPNGAILGFTDFSMSVWVRRSGAYSSGDKAMAVMGMGDTTNVVNFKNFGLMYYNDTGTEQLRITGRGYTLTTDFNIILNRWIALLITYNTSSKNFTLYLNNSEVFNKNVATSLDLCQGVNGDACHINLAQPTNAESNINSWVGQMDDFRVFDFVLNTTQRDNLYNSSFGNGLIDLDVNPNSTVVTNSRPFLLNVTVYNMSSVLGSKVQFNVLANDSDGVGDIERVDAEILTVSDVAIGKNITLANVGGLNFEGNFSIPSNFSAGSYHLNFTVFDGNLSSSLKVNTVKFSVNNSFEVLKNATRQLVFSSIMTNNSKYAVSYLTKALLINRNLASINLSRNFTLPPNYVNSSVSLINNSNGASIPFTINSSGFVNWTDVLPMNTSRQYNLTYDLSVLSSSAIVSNCTDSSSGSCTVHFNITSNHSRKLDNVGMKIQTVNLPHWINKMGELKVRWQLITGVGGGDYDFSDFASLTGNETAFGFSTYSWQNASGCSGVCIGGDGGEPENEGVINVFLANASNSSTAYSVNLTIGNNDVTEETIFSSVQTTQDLGSDSTYFFVVEYGFDESLSTPDSQSNPAGVPSGGGGGGVSVVTVGGFVFKPSSIDSFVLQLPLVSKEFWSYDFVPNREVKSCVISEPFVCTVSDNGLSVKLIVPVSAVQSRLISSIVLTDFDGNVFTIPVTLRGLNLDYAIDTQELSLPDFMRSELFFRLNDSGVVNGIKVWWLAGLGVLLFFGLFRGLK